MSAEGATTRVGVVGARGYVGAELVRLVDHHPGLDLAFASSRALEGKPVSESVAGVAAELMFEDLEPADVAARRPDVLVLALPNGMCAEFVRKVETAGFAPQLVVDLSSDRRFDDRWTYGLSEHNAAEIRTAARIANPGCYATAMHLALRPLVGAMSGPPHCFGVSGYSGAGTSPSETNDEQRLRDSLLPYKLVGHTHEREVSRHLGREVRFSPSVAPFFRGIVLTAQVELESPMALGDVAALYAATYESTSLVRFDGERMPALSEVVETNTARVGGLCADDRDGRRLGVVCVLDNLLKGAASQAIQNINLALDLEPLEGLST